MIESHTDNFYIFHKLKINLFNECNKLIFITSILIITIASAISQSYKLTCAYGCVIHHYVLSKVYRMHYLYNFVIDNNISAYNKKKLF